MDRLRQYRMKRGTSRWQGAWLDADQVEHALAAGWGIEHESEMIMTRKIGEDGKTRLVPHPDSPRY